MKEHMPKSALKPNDPRSLAEFLCFAVYSANHAFNQVYKALLDPLGLTYPQYLAMVALWESDDQTVGSLGGKLSLELSTLTPLLKRLEASGLIARRRDAADERQVRIRLTDAGTALRAKATNIPSRALAATSLTIADAQRLHREISSLRDLLN